MTYGISGPTGAGYAGQNNPEKKSQSVSKDEFLKLLTYQLKAQNPLKPYNNQEFAAQLAQFSQLEQLTDIRSLMEEQAGSNSALTETIANTALPGMLGKTAKAYTENFHFDGDNSVELGFNSPYSASSGKLSVKDEQGETIKIIELSGNALSSGDHSVVWDGKDMNGNTVPKGTYRFEAELTTSNSSTFSADTFINGKIQAVRFKSEGTLLVINGQEMTLNSIADISTG